MQVIKVYPQGFAANTYFVTEDGVHAVAIDPAQPRAALQAQAHSLTVTHVLLTHAHFDHTGGCAALQAAGAKVGCRADELPLVHGEGNAASLFGAYVPPFSVDFTFRGGETLCLAGLTIGVIAAPGHTAGGAVFRIGDHLFTGDTLFAGDVGRCDLPTGNGAQLEASVRRLYALPGDYTVCAGHGENTTLSHERRFNGWIRC